VNFVKSGLFVCALLGSSATALADDNDKATWSQSVPAPLPPRLQLKVPVVRAFEPEFAAEFVRYKQERDGISAAKCTLALSEAAYAIAAFTREEDRFRVGFLTITALRGPDFLYEAGLILFRHVSIDAEIKTREDIRKMRSKWFRVALYGAVLNFSVASLASIGWLTVDDRFWKGVFTGVTVQTTHSMVEELLESVIMRPW
jgi:hypothetical protein